MAVYLLNYISVPVYDVLIKKKKVLVAVLAIQMFLILSLRADTLGVDLDVYKIHFEHYATMSFGEVIRGFRPIGGSAHKYGVESGYVLLCWVIGKLGFSFHSFLVIYAAIVVTSVSVFIYRYCDNAALGFATFISMGGFVTTFGILRQTLGLAVLLFAIPSLVNRKFWRYSILVFIAGLFHQTLLIAWLLYFLTMFKADKVYYLTMMVLSFVAIVGTPYVYNGVILPLLLKLGKEYYIGGFEWNNMFMVIFMFALVLMLFFKRTNDYDNVMQCGFLMALPIQAMAFYIPIFSRVSNAVFLNFLCPLVSGMVCSLKTRSQRIQAKVIVYAGLGAFYLYCLLTDHVLVPYVPVWA